MNGEHVGTWYLNRSGVDVFQYADTWLDSDYRRPLSLSLPLVPGNTPHTGPAVASWFDNLLPESRAMRDRLLTRFGAASGSAFDLLAAVGRDCIGAVQLVPAETSPGDVRRIEATPMNDAAVARLLRSATTSGPLGIYDDTEAFRFSLAGAQEKVALLRWNGQWHRPQGATPTTHILKLPLGSVGTMRADMRDSVENEWLCMQFLGALGLPVAQTEIATFHDEVSMERALVVTRFDRQWEGRASAAAEASGGWIVRLPQEDFCQALAVPAPQKYESDGGPGIKRCLNLIRGGTRPDANARGFALTQLAFWLLAATDGHAKNFAVFLLRDGYVSTPIYDVLSAWPIIGKGPNLLQWHEAELAMAVRDTSKPRRRLDEITVWHWRELARQTGAPGVFDDMVYLVEQSEGALEAVSAQLPDGFPVSVVESITKGVLEHRRRFLRMLAATGQGKPLPRA